MINQSSHESLDQELVLFKMQSKKLEQWNEKLKKEALIIQKDIEKLEKINEQFIVSSTKIAKLQ